MKGKKMTKNEKYKIIAYMGVQRSGLSDEWDLVMEAVGKQVPKEPVWHEPSAAARKISNGFYKCPKCGRSVGMDDYRAEYCPGCGQRIDWSEESPGD